MISATVRNTETYETEKQTKVEDVQVQQISVNNCIEEESKNTGKLLKYN